MKDNQFQNINMESKLKINNINDDLYNELKDYNENNIKNQNNEQDDRLMYVLITLGLGNLIQTFNEKNISFTDLLLLSKESLKDIGLEMYQRNRIYKFSTSFNRYAKTYSLKEISDFFSSNKQFLFSPTIYKKMVKDNDKFNFENDNNVYNKDYFSDDENNNYNKNRYNDNNVQPVNRLRNRKSNIVSTGKSYKASKIFKKYLLIKKGVDEFLNKLNKQKEDTENMSYKYNAIIKRSNFSNDNNNINNLDIINNKNSTKKIINNFNINDGNKQIFILSEDIDENIDTNNDKNKNDEINILMGKINKLEQMKIDENSLGHLNQIKSYVTEKGLNLKDEEIISLKNEIEKITEIINKKEKLKQNLEKYNKKIEQRKKMIYNLENEYNGINYEKINKEY